MLWSTYHCVHGTSCFCTLSTSASIEPSLHQLDFFLEIFLWRLVSVLEISFNLLRSVTHTHAVVASSSHAPTNGIQHPVPSAPSVFSARLRGQSLNVCSIPNRVAIWNATNNSDFRLFQACHFEIVTTCCYCYCRLGQAL